MNQDIIARARSEGRTALDEAAGKNLLESFGIRVPKTAIVKDADFDPGVLDGLTPQTGG